MICPSCTLSNFATATQCVHCGFQLRKPEEAASGHSQPSASRSDASVERVAADGTIKECPACAMLSPISADRCLCGYRFSGGAERATPPIDASASALAEPPFSRSNAFFDEVESELSKLDSGRRATWGNVGVLIVSLVAFIGVDRMQASWVTVIIVVVIAVHELGHFVAMIAPLEDPSHAPTA